MNFNVFWSVQNNSDLLYVSLSPFSSTCSYLLSSLIFAIFLMHHLYSFWILALPILAVVAPLAMFGDLRKMYHYFQKKLIARNAVKTYQGGIKNLKHKKRS